MFIYEGAIGKHNVVKDVNLLYSTARKQLAAGKQGEAGIKIVSGSFICLMDTIGEALKILEESIKASKLPNVKIGIVCNAGEVFNEGSGKYEMEGPKSQFDCSQMVEYYMKFLNEHPLVCYLEDPMAEKNLPGWHELAVF
jgi:enolase